MVGHLGEAQAQRDAFIAHNPNMLFLVEIRMRDALSEYLPEDSPYWIRDEDGNRVVAVQHIIDPTIFLIDFTNPELQDIIIEQAVAVAKCGLYDGIFLDW